ncbi:MAG TPA: hypothetical protein VD968_14805 [Pyrinomonadaceae bacterium]|nr:hypothetical protein [Pyrinomonadaceae bacterium]
MSKSTRIRFLIVMPVLAFVAFTLLVGDVGALAQNANSSEQDANVQPMPEASPTPPRRRRGRGRRRAATRAAPSDANLSADAQANVSMDTDTGTRSPGEQTDLSGNWTGRVRMTGGHEMSGEATLSITGNSFTLSGEGMTHNGRVYAVTTRGYTGAAFYFSDITDPATNTPVVASTRVRRSGTRITITPVPFTRTRMNFTGRAQ